MAVPVTKRQRRACIKKVAKQLHKKAKTLRQHQKVLGKASKKCVIRRRRRMTIRRRRNVITYNQLNNTRLRDLPTPEAYREEYNQRLETEGPPMTEVPTPEAYREAYIQRLAIENPDAEIPSPEAYRRAYNQILAIEGPTTEVPTPETYREAYDQRLAIEGPMTEVPTPVQRLTPEEYEAMYIQAFRETPCDRSKLSKTKRRLAKEVVDEVGAGNYPTDIRARLIGSAMDVRAGECRDLGINV